MLTNMLAPNQHTANGNLTFRSPVYDFCKCRPIHRIRLDSQLAAEDARQFVKIWLAIQH